MHTERTPASLAHASRARLAALRLAAAITVALTAAPPAFAEATLDVSAGRLTFTAGSGVANALTVSLAGGLYTVDDPGEVAFVLLGGVLNAGCQIVDANTITCPESAIEGFVVNLGDLDDSADLGTVIDPVKVNPGAGGDLVVGGLAGDTIEWHPGNGSDVIVGGGGRDVLLFRASNAAEIIAVTESGSGFQITRNVASVVVDAFEIEVLHLQALGGDDSIATVPLAGTTQLLDGGDLSDVLTFAGGGACAIAGTTSITGTGFAPVIHQGFESVGVSADCSALFADGFESGGTGNW